MINLMLILLIIGAVLYWLAFKTPGVDFVLFFSSGLAFILSAAAGFTGQGQFISYYNTTIINGTTTIVPVFVNSSIISNYLPTFILILGFYITVNTAFAIKNGTRYNNENK